MGRAEQERIFKLSMFEQQIHQLQQQMYAIERAIAEISHLKLGLNDLVGAKDSEILAPIGRGIFVKAKLVSENLRVDIGQKTFVQKSVDETKEIISKQIEKLEEVKKELDKNLEKMNEEMTKTMTEAKNKEKD